MATTPSSPIPQIKKSDLDDPTLFKLNSIFKLIWGKEAAIYQPGADTTLGANLTTPHFYASGQAQPPTNPTELLTRASGDALYGSKTQRTALVTGVNPTTSETVQPVTQSGGSSGGNISSVQIASLGL